MSQTNSIHMGHGQIVDIAPRGANAWEVIFSEAGVNEYKAPAPADIKVEAIDAEGRVHPLSVEPGGSVSSVIAAGFAAGARRARVMVMHGDHFHTREALLPGQADLAAEKGPGGGSLVRFSGGAVEAKLIAMDTFELSFGGAPAPAPGDVVMQAVGPRAEDFQIRNLAITPGGRPQTLLATGKVKDATHLRLSLKSGAASEVRTAAVIR